MRYLIMKPSVETDVRKTKFGSTQEMLAAWNVVAECDSEAAAVQSLRWMFPDAVGFPAPVPIGSGHVVVLAFLAKLQLVDPGGAIPFVAIVHATGDTDIDRRAIKKNRHFDKKLWRAPVIKPTNGQVMPAELRGNELEIPERPTVIIGRERGRLVVYVELNGTANSIMFDDPRLDVYTSDAHVTVPGDGDRDDSPGPGAA